MRNSPQAEELALEGVISRLTHSLVFSPALTGVFEECTEASAEAPSPGCAIKGPASECIVHVPGGQFYGKVNMTPGNRWL